ncbi:MAG: GNAT family N-acetyltransferase [Pseudonocardiaceae bacterium]|nr:GNAT family N-acetyltransferase [Pseudonocardiaceae bacterium]
MPVAAVTAVGVAADQRRRGGLRTLMRTQLHGLHESGAEPVAALWASEAGIYGRFGYDVAARRARMAPQRVGWISRPELAWADWLHDPEHHRDGATALRFALAGEQGYAIFRAREGGDDRGPRFEIRIRELAAETPAAHAALWRFLLDLDLGAEVVHRRTHGLGLAMGAAGRPRPGTDRAALRRTVRPRAGGHRLTVPLERRPLAAADRRRRRGCRASQRCRARPVLRHHRSRCDLPGRHPLDLAGRCRPGHRARP